MPFNTPEKKAEWARQWRLAHPLDKRTPEQIAHSKLYRRKHYEKDEEWLKANRDKQNLIVSLKLTKLSPEEREYHRVMKGWIFSKSMRSMDWRGTYKWFLETTHCEGCNLLFYGAKRGNDVKCLDHCHACHEVRNVLCSKCNVERGKIDRKRFFVTMDLHRYFKLNDIF